MISIKSSVLRLLVVKRNKDEIIEKTIKRMVQKDKRGGIQKASCPVQVSKNKRRGNSVQAGLAECTQTGLSPEWFPC